MTLQPLLNLAICELKASDGETPYLAAQILAHFPKLEHHLKASLSSHDFDLVALCLTQLQAKPDLSISLLLDLIEKWQDVEITRLCITAIGNNADRTQAANALFELLITAQDDWNGEWNDGDDIALDAAKALTEFAKQLDNKQIAAILAKLQQRDLEPDLIAALLKILATKQNIDLSKIFQNPSPWLERQLVQLSNDKAQLHQQIAHVNHSKALAAYQRLSQLNAREYQPDFFAAITHADSAIKKLSIDTLCRWQYQMQSTELARFIAIKCHNLSDILPILDPQAALWLKQQLIDNQLAEKDKPAALLFIIHQAALEQTSLEQTGQNPSDDKTDVAALLAILYDLFPRLTEREQIELLSAVEHQPHFTLSCAFLRQSLTSHVYSALVRSKLIAHLSQQTSQAHQSYFRALLFAQNLDVTELPNVAKTSKDKTPSSAAVFSTLAALNATPRQQNRQETKAPNTAKKSYLDQPSNLSFALKCCDSASLLTEFAKSSELSRLAPDEFRAFIHACMRLNIAAAPLLNTEIEAQLLTYIADDPHWNYPQLWQWLGPNWIEQHQAQLLTLPNLTLVESLIDTLSDAALLSEYSQHHYIGIKQQAMRRRFALQQISDEDYFLSIIGDPQLQPLMAYYAPHKAIKQLNQIITTNAELALLGFHLLLTKHPLDIYPSYLKLQRC